MCSLVFAVEGHQEGCLCHCGSSRPGSDGAQSFDLILSRESVPVSLCLSPCVSAMSVGRQATKRVSEDCSMSVKTQVRPMKLGASKRECCLASGKEFAV